MRRFVPPLLLCLFLIFGSQSLQAGALSMNCTPMTGPTEATVAYTTTCTASGGTSPYAWSIGTGVLPKGLTLSATSGPTVKVSGTPSAAGGYLYSVKVADASSPAQSASQSFTGNVNPYQAPPTLTAMPVKLPFAAYTFGGKLPPAQSISFTSTNPSTGLAFTSSTGSDCGWLSLSFESGTTPVTLSAAVNSNVVNATVGSHSCTISFSAPGLASPPSVTATLTVSGAPITVSPNPIAVAIVAGTQQSFTSVAQVSAAAAVNITASGGAWLTADPTAQPSSAFSISVDATNLTASPPAASLQFQCVAGTQCVAATVPVNLTVYPQLNISCTPTAGPAQLSTAYSSTCTASGGNAPYNWSISSGALPTGLTMSAKTGASVKISGTPTKSGAYSYSVSVGDATPSKAQSAVQAFSGTLAAPPVTLSATPANLSFGSYTAGAAAPAAQKISVSSTNPTTGLAFTTALGADCAWLKLTPATGSTPATLSASVVTASASSGTHSCAITFSAAGVSPSPAVTATITVAGGTTTPPTATTVSAAPATVAFLPTTTAAQTVALSSANPASGIAYTTSLGTDCAWLSTAPPSGFTPATITLTPNIAKATTGSHSCGVTFNSPNLSPSPAVTATLTIGSATTPAIAAVANDASFNAGGPITPGSWVVLFGSNLGPAGDSRAWNTATEIINNIFPTALDGTSVSINGKRAAVEYISPTQINIQPSDDSSVGPVQVVVSTASGGASAPFTVNYSQFAPGLFPATATYLAAQHADGSYIGGFSGATPAKPSEVITLWGTGFGPGTQPVPAGQVFSGASPLSNPVTVTVGGQPATVKFAGIVAAGLVQINVQLPASMSDGDAPVVAIVGGVSTQSAGNMISVHN